MIRKLQNEDPDTAKKIRAVFQVSYAVEAQLLQVENFPPLKRTLDQYIHTETVFYGNWKNDALAAVLEIRQFEDSTLLQSLVVDPAYFRQGIGGQLVRFALDNFPSGVFNVETGAANEPAISLYKKYGFTVIKEYLTDHKIRKVRFEKIHTNNK